MKYLYLLISILSLSSCIENDILDDNVISPICENAISQFALPVDSCFDLPFNINGHLPIIWSDRKSFSNPIFHTEINDEFVFLKYDPPSLIVYKSNLCNEYYDEGYDLSSFSSPVLLDWNKNSELLLRINFNIWKIDFNNDELVQLTNDDKEYRTAKWCMNDSLIYSFIRVYDETSPYYPWRALLIDKTGEIDHVFPPDIGTSISDVLENKILTTARIDNNDVLGFINLDNKEFMTLWDIPILNNYTYSGYKWLDNENILFRKQYGSHQQIIKLNINTFEETLIEEVFCSNYFLEEFDVAPAFDSENILMAYTDYKYSEVSPDSLILKTKIIKKNIVTGESWVVDINL